MKRPATRGLLLAAATLAALVAAAVPAHATLTPVNTSFTATSSNSVITHSGFGIRDRCPLSHFGNRTSADGRSLSGNVIFNRSGAVTCTESFFSSSITVDCVGNATLRSTTSVAGTAASGTLVLDTGFRCEVTSGLSPDWIMRGPQTPTNCTWTLTQSTQTLSIGCNTIAKDGGGTVSWTASHAITSSRVTIS